VTEKNGLDTSGAAKQKGARGENPSAAPLSFF